MNYQELSKEHTNCNCHLDNYSNIISILYNNEGYRRKHRIPEALYCVDHHLHQNSICDYTMLTVEGRHTGCHRPTNILKHPLRNSLRRVQDNHLALRPRCIRSEYMYSIISHQRPLSEDILIKQCAQFSVSINRLGQTKNEILMGYDYMLVMPARTP